MRSPRRRGYRELIGLFAILAFAVQFSGAFWVVFLAAHRGVSPAGVAAILGATTLVAALVSLALVRWSPVPATRTMVAGLVSLAGMQVVLAFVAGPALPVLFAILYGAYIPLFFLPWNTLITEQTRAHDRGAKLSGIQLAFAIASAPAPFLGGIVAGAAGFPALFAISAGILLVAAAVAAGIRQPGDGVTLKWGPSQLGLRTCASYAAQGGIDGIIWTAVPLATYSFVQGEVALGAVFSLFALSGGAFAVVLGRWSDRLRRRWRFIVLGAAICMPLAAAVSLAPSLVVFSLANGALFATLAIAPTFVNAIVVDRLEGDAGLVMTTREVILNVARAGTSATILLLFLAGVPVQLAILLVVALLPVEALAR